MNKIREFINASGIELPDWKDGAQKKYKILYNEKSQEFIVGVVYSYDKPENRWKYVTDENVLQEVIETFPREDILELYNNG